MSDDPAVTENVSKCRNCGQLYARPKGTIDTGRLHVVCIADYGTCWDCRRSFWKGMAIAQGIWLSAVMIWWGLTVVGVIQ